MFKRKKASKDEHDDALPFMTVEAASRFRGLMRESFAHAGLEVTVHSDHVCDSEGREFGFWNVAAACHNDERGPRVWIELVDEHVHRVLASMDGPDSFEELSCRTCGSVGTCGSPGTTSPSRT